MTRETIGHGLAIQLDAAERAVDAALVQTAAFTAMLPTARAEAYLSATTGQGVFDGAAASISALTAARGHLVASHRALAAVARRLGLEIIAAGPMDKPEDERPIGGYVTRAKRVSEQA